MVANPYLGEYTGAPNQMGLHVRWFSDLHTVSIPINSFYSRDIRRFDENIEENTLVSDTCIVADGGLHGGTSSPMLQAGKMMTLWTNPNFDIGLGTNSQSTGLYYIPGNGYQSFHNACLQFIKETSNEVHLQIGDPSSILYLNGGISPPPATLVALPNFEIWLSDFADQSTDQGSHLIINKNSNFEFYGIPPPLAVQIFMEEEQSFLRRAQR